MRRRTPDQIFDRVRSRKIARALRIDARAVRAGWTATDRRFGLGRYRWYRAGLRAELMRLRMQETAWMRALTA